jgi:tetrapyrrole methylase family protein/MazG family protein
LKIIGDVFPGFSTGMDVYLNLAGVNLGKTNILGSLHQVYPDGHVLYAFEKNKWRPIALSDLDKVSSEITGLFIPALAEDSTLESFMHVIARLRAPDGCPWDRKQTHTSLRPYLLEEAYEALEALDNGNMNGLREELGDILLQIALHTQIAVENGEFTIADVLQGINRKIVSRHPHVFAEVRVRDDRDVVQNWEKLKEIERAENGDEHHKGLLDGIPAILPALSQAQSIQERAARVGFDWPEIQPVIEKVNEELQEVSQAQSPLEREHELGDLLFAVVNLVRWYKVDAESALRYTNTKFRKRFAYLEAQAKQADRELQKMTLEEMDKLWEDAKAFDDE